MLWQRPRWAMGFVLEVIVLYLHVENSGRKVPLHQLSLRMICVLGVGCDNIFCRISKEHA